VLDRPQIFGSIQQVFAASPPNATRVCRLAPTSSETEPPPAAQLRQRSPEVLAAGPPKTGSLPSRFFQPATAPWDGSLPSPFPGITRSTETQPPKEAGRNNVLGNYTYVEGPPPNQTAVDRLNHGQLRFH
jgi:hypothetical protein